MQSNISSSSTGCILSGASGMLGSAIQNELRARDVPIVKLVRRPPASPQELLWNPAASPALKVDSRLEGLAAAIHFSGANVANHRWTAAYKKEMADSRIGSTRALATTLAALRRPPRVLLAASAIGFYGDRGSELLTEESPAGTGFFPDLCRAWEAAAQPAVDAGIRVVHLRFGVVLGPHGGALAKMLPLFRLGLGGPIGSGMQWMSWISLADLVAATLFALDTPSLAGPLNLTAPHPVTNAEFTRALAHAVHRPALVPAPAFALRLAFGQMADEALLAGARVLPAKLAAAGFQFAYPTIESALAAALR